MNPDSLPESSAEPSFDPPLTSASTTRRRYLAALIADYNPFYLLSAACMLFGVFALNNSLAWSPIGMRRLLTMIVTLNAYELIVIGLATFLIRRGIRRDALLLVIVEAFFLADVGFLNMEVFATNFTIGLIVNILVFAVGVLKVAMIFDAVGISLRDRRFYFVLAQLAALSIIPGLFADVAQHRNDFLPPLAVYGGWWIIGALPAFYAMAGGSLDLFRKSPDGASPTAAAIASRMLLVLPMLSLIAHLCLANWIYKVEFHAANLAPLLLGYAIFAGHADEHAATRGKRMQQQLLLPVLALLLSLADAPRSMQFDIGSLLTLSPIKLAVAGTAVVYIEAAWHFESIAFAMIVMLGVFIAVVAHYLDAILNALTRAGRVGADTANDLLPKTLAAWGVISIIASFLLLALGTWITLTRRPLAVMPEKEDNPTA